MSRRPFALARQQRARRNRMINKVILAFAMKEELTPWRLRHRFQEFSDSPQPISFTTIGSMQIYPLLCGAGAIDLRDLNDLTVRIGPSAGIIAGVAAGLKPEWRPGDLLAAKNVSGTGREPSFPAHPTLVKLAMNCGAKAAPVLLTVPHIIRTVEEKIGWAIRGDAADMESMHLMKLWAARGIPSLALRVILDSAEMPMICDFESAMDVHGQVQISKILAQLTRHPQRISDFLHLARQSRRVLRRLAEFLDIFLGQLDQNFPVSSPMSLPS